MQAHHFETRNGTYVVHISDVGGELSQMSMFLHGGPGFNLAAERSMFAPFADQSTGFIWCDHLGCGESSARSPDRLSWDAHVDDVAQIARHYGDGPVNFVGHCLGVELIHDLVRRYRDLIASAVWVSPVRDVSDVFKTVLRRGVAEGRLDLDALTHEQRRGLDQFFAAPEADFSQGEVAFFLEIVVLVRDFQELYWSDLNAMSRYVRAMEIAPFSPDVFVRLQSDYFSRGPQEIPNYADIPVLILYSQDDGITPWDQHGSVASRAVPHAEIQQIEGGSHWIHLQRPQDTADSIASFLSHGTSRT